MRVSSECLVQHTHTQRERFVIQLQTQSNLFLSCTVASALTSSICGTVRSSPLLSRLSTAYVLCASRFKCGARRPSSGIAPKFLRASCKIPCLPKRLADRQCTSKPSTNRALNISATTDRTLLAGQYKYPACRYPSRRINSEGASLKCTCKTHHSTSIEKKVGLWQATHTLTYLPEALKVIPVELEQSAQKFLSACHDAAPFPYATVKSQLTTMQRIPAALLHQTALTAASVRTRHIINSASY